MKKIICLIGILGCIIFVFPKEKKIEEVKIENKKSNLLSMMLETSAGTGKYQKTLASSWPTEGYVFNEDLSKCEMGSSLSWDSINKKVIMEGNGADKCYVYFDKTFTLAEYVKAQYTGTQGENNLYYHDSSLENGAGDNSYRYAGSSETTNNFVCFGYDSTDGSCPTDYLYRIIGVFDDQVKLIKYDYAKSTLLGTDGDYYNTYSKSGWTGTNKGDNSDLEIGAFYWNLNTKTNVWSDGKLNTINLNKNYINNIGTKWSEKISVHTWKVGGNTFDKIGEQTAPNAYQNEINSPATNKTVNAKVGLMYVSDYMYAVPQDKWTLYGYKYGDSSMTYYAAKGVNWMYMGLLEWTLTPMTNFPDDAFLWYGWNAYHYPVNFDTNIAVRPVLYLKSTVGYSAGSGTISSPYILAD